MRISLYFVQKLIFTLYTLYNIMDLTVRFVIGQALRMEIEIIFLAILPGYKMQNV